MEELRPEFRLESEIEEFIKSIDLPNDGARQYLAIHLPRIVRTLAITPPGDGGSALELGAYMHMTPALQCVLGYQKVRGAYLGPLGRTEHKNVTVGGRKVFECFIDLFDVEKHKWPYEDGRFRTVLACEIFEHLLHDPMHLLVEAHRVLDDSGALVLTTPNIASYAAVARVLEQIGNPQLYSKYPNPQGEHSESEIPHVREYTARELAEALNSAGFQIDALFTEMIPGFRSDTWVHDFLVQNNYPTTMRGEQIYCVARKIPGAAINRYPGFLYDL
jgi:predicted SAM-dependent methyltransferase